VAKITIQKVNAAYIFSNDFVTPVFTFFEDSELVPLSG
jgi:hypothetical protein